MSASVARKTRVLIVGTGLSGSLTCYHLRALAKKKVVPIRIDVADMARGPGGRMSTTRYGADNTRANTGAQYLSTSSPEAAALLERVCASSEAPHDRCPLDRVEDPVKRSTHFVSDSDDAYTHWLPREGTNSVVKQFLRGGEPDRVVLGSRLQHMAIDSTSPTPQLVPLFDSGGTASAYDIAILAMPPKDIIKFFNDDKQDPQSQADLHRRTNRGNKRAPLSPKHRGIILPDDVLRRLRTPSYVGRYSLALWFHDADFADRAHDAWNARRGPHPVLDAVSSQPGGVLVAQSTVELWRRLADGRKGRSSARSAIEDALERLAGGKIPRAKNSKLLNWRTSQVNPPAGGGVVVAEGGRLVFAGDWCYESSFEGCNLAAEEAASAVMDTITSWADGAGKHDGTSSVKQKQAGD